ASRPACPRRSSRPSASTPPGRRFRPRTRSPGTPAGRSGAPGRRGCRAAAGPSRPRTRRRPCRARAGRASTDAPAPLPRGCCTGGASPPSCTSLLEELSGANRLSHSLRLLAVHAAVVELDRRVQPLPGQPRELLPLPPRERTEGEVVLDPGLVERLLHAPARVHLELQPHAR